MKPIIGLIGGTGLGQALLVEVDGESQEVETPFGKPSAAIIRGNYQDVEVAILSRHGPDHTIPPSAVPFRANIYALKKIGVTHILASGATGSLREEIRPRDLVIPDQVIDRTTQRVSTFFDESGIAAHVEFADPFCPSLRKILLEAGESVDTSVHDGGTYICMEGPAFSTVAESRMHRAWGGDLIGMTCMPEAKLAREAEICYGLVCLPTDYDCWRPHDPSLDKRALLREILDNVQHATMNSIKLLKAVLRRIAVAEPSECECQKALSLAVWTKPESIDSDVRKRLGVILDRNSNASV